MSAPANASPAALPTIRWGWLPPMNSPRYYLMLAVLGIFILGPLGGVTASYMNFSIGFFVGGQVLAGILGSTVTLGYGPEGKHGANYMQTAAASVAGMAGMGVLIQAMVWMGLPQPPLWQLMLFMGAIGMFGAGVGMLYTPILVDRLQLTFPSGLAVANILRALTDPVLLKRSVSRLGTGVGLGLLGGLGSAKPVSYTHLGPFYPPRAWRQRWADWDADLTRVVQDGQTLTARGEHLGLAAVVADTRGRVIDGAEVEIWQCDVLAHYRHPRVPQQAGGFDPGFQGLGLARSDASGALRFRTIRPVAYPGRTPHIHLKVRHASFGELTTQLFVDGEPGNARDFLWRQLDEADRAPLAMRLQPAPADSGLRWLAQHTLVVPAG